MKRKIDIPATVVAVIFICIGIAIIIAGKVEMTSDFTVSVMEYTGISAFLFGLSILLTGLVIIISANRK